MHLPISRTFSFMSSDETSTSFTLGIVLDLSTVTFLTGFSLLLQAGGLAEIVGARALLPGETWLAAAEMAVGRRPREDRPFQPQVTDDRGRSQVEVLAD